MNDQPKSPRFRIVLELTFADGDPWNPNGYAELLERLKQRVENDPELNCKDVCLRDALTISPMIDDYDDWRYHRGQYDTSTWPREAVGQVRSLPEGPALAVDTAKLKRLWELRGSEEGSKMFSDLDAIETDPHALSLAKRLLLLMALESKGTWPNGEEANALFERAASIDIKTWDRDEKQSIIRELQAFVRPG